MLVQLLSLLFSIRWKYQNLQLLVYFYFVSTTLVQRKSIYDFIKNKLLESTMKLESGRFQW